MQGDPAREPDSSPSFDQADPGEGDMRLAAPGATADKRSPDAIGPAPMLGTPEPGEGDMRLGSDASTSKAGKLGTSALAFALAAGSVIAFTSAAGRAAPPAATRPAPAAAVDFVRDIKPLLESRCVRCHGPDKASNEYRLDTRDGAFKGGEKSDQTSTDPIVPGDAAGSLTFQFITSQNPDRKMPPKGKAEPFTPAQIELLRKWIDGGAAWPDKVDLKAPPEAKDAPKK